MKHKSNRLVFFLTFLICLQARTYLDPAEIFKSEAEEAYEKTRKAIEICSFFKETFEDVRRNIQKFFKEGQQVKQWEFANELVFTRMDLFISRLKTVEVGTLNTCLVLKEAALQTMRLLDLCLKHIIVIQGCYYVLIHLQPCFSNP